MLDDEVRPGGGVENVLQTGRVSIYPGGIGIGCFAGKGSNFSGALDFKSPASTNSAVPA
jgi:hypothetical protein